MSMRSILFDIKLEFDNPENQDDSEDLLMRMLGIVCRHNLMYLKKHPETKRLYDSGVVYTPPDQSDGRPPIKRNDLKKLTSLLKEMGAEPETALMVVRLIKGIEIFLDTPALYRRGKGDCNELVPVRVAELWRAGIAATPYLVKQKNLMGGYTYHALVQWPDKSSEDVSLILGMGGKERAQDRKEEIRKNKERWDNYMAAAAQLMKAEDVSPDALGKQIEALGLAPSDGIFRSPY